MAVRDHTAIVRDGAEGAIVHLSHNFVAPEWRRTGLAGWLRALPIQTGRTCLAEQQRPANSPITLVGEMKFLDRNDPSTSVRLKAYEKAGYLMIDPRKIHYLNPTSGAGRNRSWRWPETPFPRSDCSPRGTGERSDHIWR